jgi:hypothetical protein
LGDAAVAGVSLGLRARQPAIELGNAGSLIEQDLPVQP